MRKTITIILVLITVGAAGQAPCSGAKYREFDFWVGSWEVFSRAGKFVGKSKIRKINDGCAIEENWSSVGSSYVGKSINVYNEEKKKWEQHWFASDASIKFSGEGEYRDNAMRFVGHDKDARGEFVTNFIFYNDGPDKMRQYLERSYDAGKTFTPVFELTYKRKSDEEEIRAVNEKYVTSWLKGDENAVLSLFTDDAVLSPGGTSAKTGKAQMKDFWFPRDGSLTRILHFSNDIQNVTIDGDAAMTSQLDHLEWTYTKNGATTRKEQRCFAMSVYQKQSNGEWKIIHQMWKDFKVVDK